MLKKSIMKKYASTRAKSPNHCVEQRNEVAVDQYAAGWDFA
jgi:hypothetical protein